MARPVRVDVEGGWYHITARGIERRTIISGKREAEHFLELLEEMTERYGVQVHAYSLMGNHYHLIIRTPRANASAAIQWLNVSYSVWFNKRRDRVGHVFQGRFGSKLIDGEGSWVLIASAYVHLNAVRRSAYGLGKVEKKAEARGYKVASDEEVRKRLEVLRGQEWSSYRAYVGLAEKPKWLFTGELLKCAGGREEYRKFVESYVRQGGKAEEWEGLKARVVVGAQEFVRKAKGFVKRLTSEQPERRRFDENAEFSEIVEVVSKEHGGKWEEFRDAHGDWGRDMVLHLARRRSGLTLRKIGRLAGGMDYKAVSAAVARMRARLERDRKLRPILRKCNSHL